MTVLQSRSRASPRFHRQDVVPVRMGYPASIFVDEVEPTHMCPVCSDVVDDAISACAEGHNFCKQCIMEWQSMNDTCPICREVLMISTNRYMEGDVSLQRIAARVQRI